MPNRTLDFQTHENRRNALSRRPCQFKQTDLTRALKGTRAAGIEIDRIEIDKDGKIVVFPRKGAEDNADAIGEKITDLDKWMADDARQTKRHQIEASGSPTARCEPISTPGRADRRCAASPARRIHRQLQRGRRAQGDAAARHAAQLAAGVPGERGFSSARRQHAAQLHRADQRIEKEFGDFPLSALSDRRTRGIFRHGATSSPPLPGGGRPTTRGRCSRAYSRGARPRLVDANPCERGGRLYRGSRAEKIWTDDDEAAFSIARRHICTCRYCSRYGPASARAISCGLPWSAYDGTHIRLRQSKDRRAHVDPGWRAAQGRARCDTKRGRSS